MTDSMRDEDSKQDEQEGRSRKEALGEYWQECKKTSSLAWPLMLTQLSQTALQPVSTMFGGHLGEYELDAVVLANSVINVFGNAVVMGTGTACDTYFAQAHGRKEFKTIGIVLQRSLYIHILLALTLVALYLNVGHLLEVSGQNPVVARITQQYVDVFLPGLLFLFLFTILRKYLACQNIVLPTMIIGFIGIGVAALFQYINIYVLVWGVSGSSLAQVYGCAFMFLATLGYIIVSKAYKESWYGLQWQALDHWGSFTKLSVHGMFMVCIEWWAFEIFIILTGLLGTTQLAAAGLVVNVDMLFFALRMGLADATGIRVGQTLGADRPQEAKTATKVGMALVIMVCLASAIILLAARFEIPKLFTTEGVVLDLAASLMFFPAIYCFFDGVTCIARGVFRGCGKQVYVSVALAVTFSLIGFPIGVPLMFCTSVNVFGTFTGITCALLVAAVGLFIHMFCIMDYKKAAEMSSQKVTEGQSNDVTNATTTESSTGSACGESSYLLSGDTQQRRNIILWRIGDVMIVLIVVIIGILCRVKLSYSVSSEVGNNTT